MHKLGNIVQREEGSIAFELSEYLYVKIYACTFIEPLLVHKDVQKRIF